MSIVQGNHKFCTLPVVGCVFFSSLCSLFIAFGICVCCLFCFIFIRTAIVPKASETETTTITTTLNSTITMKRTIYGVPNAPVKNATGRKVAHVRNARKSTQHLNERMICRRKTWHSTDNAKKASSYKLQCWRVWVRVNIFHCWTLKRSAIQSEMKCRAR